MARLNPHHSIAVSGTITFGEAELRALDALIGYGADSFIEAFYEKMGKVLLVTTRARAAELVRYPKGTNRASPGRC